MDVPPSLSTDIPPRDSSSPEPSSPKLALDTEDTAPPSTAATSPDSSTVVLPPLSSSATSSVCNTPSLNVKFAPLPELTPRKRRSNAPLGMAARGQLVRRRRGNVGDEVAQTPVLPVPDAQGNAIWRDQEMEEQRRRYEAIAARNAIAIATINAREVEEDLLLSLDDDEEEEEKERAPTPRHRGRHRSEAKGEEKLGPLGKLVRGAGKTLWKRVASKDLTSAKAKYQQEQQQQQQQQQKQRPRRQSDPGPPPSPPNPAELPPSPPIPRPILATITPNAPETLPDHVHDPVWDDVGETDTLMEGRPIYERA